MLKVESISKFQEYASKSEGIIYYFSHEDCNICKVLLPKIKLLLSEKFQKLKIAYCDVKEHPEIAAQNSIFTVPTLLIFFDGKEYHRFSRNIGIYELEQYIARPYQLIF
jgi:thioredoxin-like negative regulator of GroEL